MTEAADVDMGVLRQRVEGQVIEASSPEFEHLPKPNNARFDHVRPRAIVLCESARDVAEAVAFVRRHRLRTAIRSAGHCFAGRSSTSGLLIDVSPMSSVSAANGVATIGSGARLGEVYVALNRQGVTIPGGTCPSVGVAGLTLGGGLGMLGRKHGLTSDWLVAATVVLADGRVVDCDEHHEPDLFWALRGGGAGNFGVVTEFVFQTLRRPAVVTTFRLTWGFAAASKIVGAWLGWSGSAPDEIAASLDLRAGEDPGEPASVEVFGSMLAAGSDAKTLLERLTLWAGVDPVDSHLHEGSYIDALHYWAGRAGEQLEHPRLGSGTRQFEAIKSEYFARPLPAEAVESIVRNFAERPVPDEFRNIDFSPWGGAYNRLPPDATAFVHRNALYWIKHTAAVPSGASNAAREAARLWVERSWSIARPYGNGLVFPNFPDPDLEEWGSAYYGASYPRLSRIKAQYDPDNRFRFSQSLPVR